jgi:hypothetical protein
MSHSRAPSVVRGTRATLLAIVLGVLLVSVVPVGTSGASASPLAPAARAGPVPSPPDVPAAGPAPAPELRATVRHSSVLYGFPGLNASAPGCACLDANVSFAAGPNDSVEFVNGFEGIFALGGGPGATANTSAFFARPGDLVRDPAVVYDDAVGRFVAVALDLTRNSLVLGCSAGSNASSGFGFVSIGANGTATLGAPSIGIAGDAIALAVPASNATGVLIGTQLVVLNASDLAQLGSAVSQTWGPAGVPVGLFAVGGVGPGALPRFAVENGTAVLDEWVTATPPVAARLMSRGATAGAYPGPLAAPQNGTTDLLAPPAPGFASGVWARGILSLVGTVSVSGTDAVELFQLNTTTGAVVEDLLLQNGSFLLYPAVSADLDGNVVVVADASGPTLPPSVVVAGDPFGDPNVTTPLTLLVHGNGTAGTPCSGLLCRWGTRSWAAPDPLDPSEVWVAGEFAPGNGTAWSTYVGVASYPALAPPVVLSDFPTIDVGQWVNFSGFVTGGVMPYLYAWHGVPPGCGGGGGSLLQCRPNGSGSFNVTLTVTDASGARATSAALPFVVSPTLTLAPIARSRTIADAGQSVTFTTSASGGLPPYAYTWRFPASQDCTPAGATLTCALSAVGLGSYVATVTDRNAVSAGVTTSLRVHSVPHLGAIVWSPASLPAGGNASVLTNLTGGSGGYTYLWAGLPPGCAAVDLGNFTCRPTAVGTYTIVLRVNDSAGLTANGTTTLTVTNPPPVGSSGSSAPPYLGWVVLGVLGIVVLVVVLPLLLRRARRPPAPGSDSSAYPARGILDEYDSEGAEGEGVPALPAGEEPPADEGAGGFAPGGAP